MTQPHDDIEARLTRALRADHDEPPAGDDSLATIRARTGTARRRRRAVAAAGGVAALVALAVAVPVLRSSSDEVTTGPAATTTTSEPPTSSTTTPDTTMPPAADAAADALWPDPAGTLYDDPVEVVRDFVTSVVGVDDPQLLGYDAGEPGAGEVRVARTGEDGGALDGAPAGTVTVRRLDGTHWFVTAADSPDVAIDSPERLAEVSSPVPVTGRGRGYEGTIVTELRDRAAGAPLLGRGILSVGQSDELAPFAVDVSADPPAGAVSVLLVRTDVGPAGATPSFAALPLHLHASSTEPTEPTGPDPGAGAGTEGFALGAAPLWPFGTLAEADEWLAASQEGHQPWHADAEATARAFTTGYLGFGGLDVITSREVGAREAWVGVGYETEDGSPSTAAVVHLVRFGPTADAPWEVVGTRDTTLTLDTPRYGSTVSSPVTVGGVITGVDESLRVEVRQRTGGATLGRTCCVAAGGEATPWETTVEFSGATDPELTIVVSTGGHVRDIERFAITGVEP